MVHIGRYGSDSMSIPSCFGNYMDCSECKYYVRCKLLNPRNGAELRKNCIRCEKCIFANLCSLTTLAELTA